MNTCPSPENLRRLLTNTADAGEFAAAFAAHLESCPVCQRALDQLTLTGPLPDALSDPTPSGAQGPGTDAVALSGANRSSTPPTPTVPGYQVLGLLGRGGMGVVWQARQTGLNRLVAL